VEDVNCLLCGHAERRVRFRGKDRLHHVPGEFTLVECARCGFLYLSPRPDSTEIQRYYPDDYLPFRSAIHEERSPIRRFDRLFGLHKRCQVIRQFKSEGYLLDVGCGTGDFLAVMRSYRGWEVRGLEPHGGAVARAREKYGLAVDHAYLDDVPYAPGTFDVVTMWDVLEHVPRPLHSLRHLRDALRPDGVVIIGLPNRDSLDARLFGQYWAGLDVPRHFSVFSVAHITHTLLEAGYEKPYVLNLNGGYHTFALSVRFWLDEVTCDRRPNDFVVAALGSLPARLLTFPYFSVLKWTKKGSTMILVARTLK
jgi:SAM-dependent methyltransferase